MEVSPLIAPFVTGLQHNKESWLCAPDSFQQMLNAKIEHGYICPSKGYYVVATLPSKLPVTGFALHSYENLNKETLIWDTQNLWKYVDGKISSTPINSTPLFDSSFHFVKHTQIMSNEGDSYIFFTSGAPLVNNKEGIWFYKSPQTISSFSPNLTEGTVVGAKAVGFLRGRLLLFGTYESVNKVITYHPTRVRWSAAGTPHIFEENSGGGYADAAVSGEIMGVAPLQNLVVVSFTSGLWALDSTWDTQKPFVWRRCDDNVRCFSEGSLISFPLDVKIIGPRGIISTDSRQVERIDTLIPLYLSKNMEGGQGKKFFGLREYIYQSLWYLYQYSEGNASYSRALIRDEITHSYSTYEVPFTILGYGSDALNYKCSDFTEENNKHFTVSSQIGLRIKDYRNQGEETFLGGDNEGNVYEINKGYYKSSLQKSFLHTAEWNPFVNEGRQSRFLYLDIFLEVIENQTLTVSFFKDTQTLPYKRETLSLLPQRGFIGKLVDVVVGEQTLLIVPAHGLQEKTLVYIYEVQGMTNLNSLDGIIAQPVSADVLKINVSSLSWEKYTRGGVLSLYPISKEKTWKRVYAGGTGYTHSVALEFQGIEVTYFKLHALKPRFIARGKRLL